jgi:hypothetical protein
MLTEWKRGFKLKEFKALVALLTTIIYDLWD